MNTFTEAQIIALIIEITGGLIVILIASALSYLVGLRKNLKLSYSPLKIKKGHKKNTVLLIGLGKTGKSSLVETLTRLDPEPSAETNNFSITTDKKQDQGKPPIHLHYTDYRGQDFAQLISNFVQEQLEPRTIIRYGDINSLILMIDLFRHVENEDSKQKYPDLDTERIQDHLGQWNKTALDAVFGLLTKRELNYICLFINKIDKWEKGNAGNANKIIEEKYSSLIDELLKRSGKYAEFDVRIGSATEGTNITGQDSLVARLAKYSVPLEKSK
ncbi:MAG: GTPase domain-containing protein [bacterium]|nr:GTPase domain-containing protein [bacterium]